MAPRPAPRLCSSIPVSGRDGPAIVIPCLHPLTLTLAYPLTVEIQCYHSIKFSTAGSHEPLRTQPPLEGPLLKLTNGDKGLGAVTAAGSPMPLGVERSPSCGQYSAASVSLGPASCHCSDPPAPPPPLPTPHRQLSSVLSGPGAGEEQPGSWSVPSLVGEVRGKEDRELSVVGPWASHP